MLHFVIALVVVQGLLLALLLVRNGMQLPAIEGKKLNDIEAVWQGNTRASLLFTMLVEFLSVGGALVGTAWFGFHHKMPEAFVHYLVLVYGVFIYESIVTWYKPMIFGGSSVDQVAKYKRVYGQTHHIVFRDFDEVCPNTVYVTIHVLILLTAGLIVLWGYEFIGEQLVLEVLDAAAVL